MRPSHRSWLVSVLFCLALPPKSALSLDSLPQPLPFVPGIESAVGLGSIALSPASSSIYKNSALLATAQQKTFLVSSEFLRGRTRVSRGILSFPVASSQSLAFAWTEPRDHSAVEQGRIGRELQISYAQRLPLGLSWGTGLNLQDGTTSSDRPRSFSSDFGVSWQATSIRDAVPEWAQNLRLGLALHNPLRDDNSSQGHSTPRRLGVACAASLKYANWKLFPALGAEVREDAHPSLSGGIVASVSDKWSMAIGVDKSPRLGLGWRNELWSLGYSWSSGRDNTPQQLFANLKWGKTTNQRRIEEHARLVQEQEENNQRLQSTVANAIQAYAEATMQQLHDRAATALVKRDLPTARSLYYSLWVTDPSDSVSLEGLRKVEYMTLLRESTIFIEQKQYSPAIEVLVNILQLVPEDSSSMLRLREARKAVREISENQNESSKVFRQGIDQYSKRQYLKAARSFRVVLKIDPDHATVKSYLRQAEQLHHKKIQQLLNRVRTQIAASEFAVARDYARRLLDLEPKHRETLELLATVEILEEKARKAEIEEQERQALLLASIQEIVVEDPAPPPPIEEVEQAYREGMRLYRIGNLDAAMLAWEKVSHLIPHFEEVDTYLLRTYRVVGLESYTEGHLAEAVGTWEKALVLDPDNRQLRRYLIQANAKLRRAQPNDPGGW